jgi:hypothetical protein
MEKAMAPIARGPSNLGNKAPCDNFSTVSADSHASYFCRYRIADTHLQHRSCKIKLSAPEPLPHCLFLIN